jgi:hypothetical protein
MHNSMHNSGSAMHNSGSGTSQQRAPMQQRAFAPLMSAPQRAVADAVRSSLSAAAKKPADPRARRGKDEPPPLTRLQQVLLNTIADVQLMLLPNFQTPRFLIQGTSDARAAPALPVTLTAQRQPKVASVVRDMLQLFTRDVELIDFVQEHVSVEVAMLVAQHLDADCKGCCARLDDAEAGVAACSAFQSCVDGRGALVVGLVSVLVGAPRLPDVTRDPEASRHATLVTQLVLRHYAALQVTQRGCIALQRMAVAAASHGPSATAMIACVTAALPRALHDDHANYVASTLIRFVDAAPADAAKEDVSDYHRLPIGRALNNKELRSATWRQLRFTCRGYSQGSSPEEPAPFKSVDAAAWDAFVEAVVRDLATDLPLSSATPRSYVLQRCLLHLDTSATAACRASHRLIAAVFAPAALAQVCKDPTAFHILKAAVELTAKRPDLTAERSALLSAVAQWQPATEDEMAHSVKVSETIAVLVRKK